MVEHRCSVHSQNLQYKAASSGDSEYECTLRNGTAAAEVQ